MKTQDVLFLGGILCIFFSTFFGWFPFFDIMEESKILRTGGMFIPFLVGAILVSWDTKKNKPIQKEETMQAILAIDLMSYMLSGIILYYLNL